VDLVKDPKNLMRIAGAESKIVVGVAPVVEVETAEPVLVEEPRDDRLDLLGVVNRATGKTVRPACKRPAPVSRNT
jgi:hypothetical protein